ncbi:MAG: phage tail tube protein [Sphingomonas sp.]
MGTRARGANAKAIGAFEATPGTVPANTDPWFKLPFVSHTLGEERPLISSDLLGEGREMQDPTPDVATNDGDMVVPVDARNFGNWLKLFFGAPTTTGTEEDGYEHEFVSGAAALPSMSIEIGAPEVPAFSVHRGARGNQLKIGMTRSGLLNATCSLICVGETDPVAASVGAVNPTVLAVTRFPQAVGAVKKDGVALGSVVSADFTYSNNLEKVETIQADGRIEDSDPGQAMMSGSITVRFKDTTLLTAATAGTSCELDFGWVVGELGLLFAVPRVFLPKPKRPISGPNGIQAQFNWQASGANGNAVTVTLSNDVASY